MRIILTRHAKEKFSVLRRHGVRITKAQVIGTVRTPEYLDRSRLPLLVAQAPFDPMHVLRVVYRPISPHDILIITFYPGRISQYGQS